MKDKLTIAEQEAVNQIRRWPTMYGSAHDFFHDCIVSGQGSYTWKRGKLVYGERKYAGKSGDKSKFVAYPFKASLDFARSVLNKNHDGFISVNPSGYAPINHIPDDAHPDWLEFIGFHLFLDSKIAPGLYDLIVQVHSIRHYGMTHNPNAGNGNHYREAWANYFKKIPGYTARIRNIEETKQTGKIPPGLYLGIDI